MANVQLFDFRNRGDQSDIRHGEAVARVHRQSQISALRAESRSAWIVFAESGWCEYVPV